MAYKISSKRITVIPAGASLEELEIPRTKKMSAKQSKFFRKHPKFAKFWAGTKRFGEEVKEDYAIAKEKAKEGVAFAKKELGEAKKVYQEGKEAVKGGAEIVRGGAKEVSKFYKEGAKQEARERKELGYSTPRKQYAGQEQEMPEFKVRKKRKPEFEKDESSLKAYHQIQREQTRDMKELRKDLDWAGEGVDN